MIYFIMILLLFFY